MVHPHRHCIELCNLALDAAQADVPKDLYWDVHDYINEHDEWGLGMEILIDQISEFEIKITLEQYHLIEQAMVSMGLGDSDRLQHLRKYDVVV